MVPGGRSVLVTGASRGIGAATARAFAEAGDRVAVNYASSLPSAEEVLHSLAGQGHVLPPADVGDPAAVRQMVDRVAEAMGGIDVLVNNAGIYVPHEILEVSYEQWQQAWSETLAVNLVGAANVTWCAVRHMRNGGSIVNVGSRGAFRGEPRHPAYGASKAALVAFGQSLAQALGPRRIAVTTVAPGWTETDMSSVALAGPDGERRRQESPLGRAASPGELARAIVYLASPDAEYATGAVLDFNGASYLRV
jgi:3-oxoacyl-[acyl-carrier protein] reductase